MRLTIRIFIIGLFVFIMSSFLSSILFSHLVFDEGYNLQVSLNMWNYHSYATFDKVFDEHISTGWPLLLPTSILVSFSWWAPRLVVLIYTLTFFILIARYVYTSQIMFVFFLLFFSIIPLSFLFSTHVIGEMPAYVWIVASYILLEKKRYDLAGACVGLAVITKNMAVFAIVPVVYFMITWYKSENVGIRNFLKFFLFFFLPILCGEIFRLSMLGSVHAYFQNVFDFALFAHSQTSVHADLIIQRLNMLHSVFGYPPWLLILFLCFSYFGAFRFGTKAGKLIALYGAVYGLYYLLLSPNSFYRPFFPVILGAAVSIPYWYRVRLGFFGIFIFFIVCIFGLLHAQKTYTTARFLETDSLFIEYRLLPLFTPDRLLNAQLHTARVLKDKTVSGIGWHNAPELSYMLNKHIYRDYRTHDSCYIVTGYILPLEQEEVLRGFSSLFYKNEYYRVYKKNGC